MDGAAPVHQPQESDMYAVVTTGGKQYRVEAGSELIIERLAEEPGASITFDRVLLLGDGEAVTVGSPTVDGASVSGTVLAEELGPKLIIFKFKQKVKYRRTRGHRQHLTRVRIDEINTGEKKAEKAEKATKAEEATEVEADAAAAPDAPTARPARTKKADAEVEADAPAKPARTRKPAKPKAAATQAEATEADADAPAKPAPRRRGAASKASKDTSEAEE
jgi:large subunit ribosomal protein L21